MPQFRPHALMAVAVAAVFAASLATGLAQGPGPGRVSGPPPADTAGQRGGGRGQPTRDTGTTNRIGTGAIAGAVLTDGTGQPVRRARVSLSGAELGGGRSVLSDDQGQFLFQALPAGRFTITASKAGFVDASYGSKRAGRPGTAVQLVDGQKVEKLAIMLPRGGVITGTVVDETGEPAPATQVRAFRYVMRTGERSLQQAGQDQTDDRGVYRIFQLQPGDYIVSAVPRNLTVGDLRENISSQVAALVQQAGQAQGGGFGGRGLPGLADGPGAQAILARANELQQQLATAELDQAVAYAPVYYPGTTTTASATTLTVNAGEERASVDFRLQLVPTARVDGSVLSADGSPLPATTSVALVSVDRAGLPGIPGVSANTTRPNASGQFSFRNVTPGQYVVQARANVFRGDASATPAAVGRGGPGGRGGTPISQVLWASAEIFLNGQNESGLLLALQPGLALTGRVDFEGSAARPMDLTRIRVSLNARGQQVFEIGTVPPGEVDATGRFSIAGVPPGRYVFSASVPSASQATGDGGRPGGAGRGFGGAPQAGGTWSLKSALVNGVDALDFPLELGPGADVNNAVLTFTDRSQELSGTIQDASGRPTSDFTIIVFPTDRRYWMPQARRIASARPGTDGRFAIRGLPAGEYRLTAVTDVEPGEWYDPAFLTQLAAASISISLADGEQKTQDIRLATGR